MTFNSLQFLVFFLVVYLAYRCLPHRGQNILLLVASYVFYATWDIRFVFLIVLSTILNYGCGIMIRDGKMSVRERAIASCWIVLSCFFFVVAHWNYLAIPRGTFGGFLDWGRITSWNRGWILFLTVCTLTLISNLLYSRLASITEERRRNLFLVIAVSTNLSILGLFRYFNFFVENVEWLLQGLNLDPTRFRLNIILPIGISFYTFKAIGYVVDVYRGEIEPEHRYTDLALFIGFFPALLAGPIDRPRGLLTQISVARKLTIEKTLRGLHLIFYGLFKKVVIADGVVRTVSSVYGSTGRVSWIDVVVATILFTIQIYCDFSGYTDMARGTAKLFGIDLMMNFKLPYFSKTPREFWSRWHISLSTWLRDYLYIPLGGNRLGTMKTYRNLMLTMVLGGLWHGAAWNFVLWGFYHGLVLTFHRAILSAKETVRVSERLWISFSKGVLFFFAVSYGWLLFRAPSFDKIVSLTSTLIFDFGNMNLGAVKPRAAALFGLPVFLCIEIIENATNGKSFYERLPIPAWTAIYASMIFGLVIGMSTESARFIYFNF
jgi:alginate O-acetyltransferase complex protein AlgI